MTFLFVSSQVYIPASFRPYLTVTPSKSALICLQLVILLRFTTLHGTLTGDFNPISSRPCRAYTNHLTLTPSSPVFQKTLVCKPKLITLCHLGRLNAWGRLTQPLCLNNLYQEFKESREDSVRISSVHLDNSSCLFYNMNY